MAGVGVTRRDKENRIRFGRVFRDDARDNVIQLFNTRDVLFA